MKQLLAALLTVAILCSCSTVEPQKKKKRGPSKPRVVYVQKVKTIVKKSKPRVIIKQAKPRVVVVTKEGKPRVVVVREKSSPQPSLNAAQIRAHGAQIQSLRDQIRSLEGEIIDQAASAANGDGALEDVITEDKKRRRDEAADQVQAIDNEIDKQREILATPTPTPSP